MGELGKFLGKLYKKKNITNKRSVNQGNKGAEEEKGTVPLWLSKSTL